MNKKVQDFIEDINLTYALNNFVYKFVGVGYPEEEGMPDLNEIDKHEIIEVLDYLKNVEYACLSDFAVSRIKNLVIEDEDLISSETIMDIDEYFSRFEAEGDIEDWKNMQNDPIWEKYSNKKSSFESPMFNSGFAFEKEGVVFVFTICSIKRKEFQHIGSKFCKHICLN